MNTKWLERFYRVLYEPIKPWWFAVVAYLVCGLVLIAYGATQFEELEKAMKPITICFGALFSIIGILVAIGGFCFKKK